MVGGKTCITNDSTIGIYNRVALTGRCYYYEFLEPITWSVPFLSISTNIPSIYILRASNGKKRFRIFLGMNTSCCEATSYLDSLNRKAESVIDQLNRKANLSNYKDVKGIKTC